MKLWHIYRYDGNTELYIPAINKDENTVGYYLINNTISRRSDSNDANVWKDDEIRQDSETFKKVIKAFFENKIQGFFPA